MDRILALLDEANARATFFTLGWIAERHRGVVRRILEGGHELASHGYAHIRVSEQGPAAFRSDIRRAKLLLEDLVGIAVKGYRAPSFSIGEATLWAFDCIAEAGYRYSSSVYPIRHDHYGIPGACRFPLKPVDGLLEIPVSTTRIANTNLPAAGGGYFRLLPYPVSRAPIRRVNRVDRRAALFYFHPWELDPGQPRVMGTCRRTRFRHYLNLHRMEGRLRRLLHGFTWRRMDETFIDAIPA